MSFSTSRGTARSVSKIYIVRSNHSMWSATWNRHIWGKYPMINNTYFDTNNCTRSVCRLCRHDTCLSFSRNKFHLRVITRTYQVVCLYFSLSLWHILGAIAKFIFLGTILPTLEIFDNKNKKNNSRHIYK